MDWCPSKPFEMVLKRIRDKKALSEAQIVHLERYRIPNYQWGAIGVNSRFKLIAYSREKSWTNGLRWYLWVIFSLRSHGGILHHKSADRSGIAGSYPDRSGTAPYILPGNFQGNGANPYCRGRKVTFKEIQFYEESQFAMSIRPKTDIIQSVCSCLLLGKHSMIEDA